MKLPLPHRERDDSPGGLLRRDDVKFAAARIVLFQYFTLAVFFYLISGFWDIQVRNPEFYSERAERNRIKAFPISAPRGKILDRDGRVIVDNRSFEVEVMIEITHKDRATVEEERNWSLRLRDRDRKLIGKLQDALARIDAGLDTLWVSIDGASPECYVDVRREGQWLRVMENLERLRDLKIQKRSTTPEIGVSFVAMRRNLAELPELLRLEHRIGARKFLVTNVYPHTPELLDEMLYRRSIGESLWGRSTIRMARMDPDRRFAGILENVIQGLYAPRLEGAELLWPVDTCPFVARGSTCVRSNGPGGGARPSRWRGRGSAASVRAARRCALDPGALRWLWRRFVDHPGRRQQAAYLGRDRAAQSAHHSDGRRRGVSLCRARRR